MQVPSWISYEIEPAIDTYSGREVMLAYVRCDVCDVQDEAPVETGIIQQFVHQHSQHRSRAPNHYGLGDAIAAATKAVGIEPCSPCEARRKQLNDLFPRVFRR